ncbi:MAG: P-II family nitrogen regulator [Salinibacter sp.]
MYGQTGSQGLLLGIVLSALAFGRLSAETAQAQPRGLPDTLTFERATALLLDRNQLQAARARVQAEGQAARADALFPNPTLGISEEHTPLPGDGADEWARAIAEEAQTGRRGDGKIFVLPVTKAIDVRTHETGETVV